MSTKYFLAYEHMRGIYIQPFWHIYRNLSGNRVSVRTDGLTAEDRSQLDHAGVLRVVKFREPFPGNLPLMARKVLLNRKGCLKKHSWTTIGSTSRLIPLPGVSRLS